MLNATQRQLYLDNPASTFNDCSLTAPACSNSTTLRRPEAYLDALVAKQRALSLLQSALVGTSSPHTDVVLAVVLLFIEYELIDSGRDDWRYHINGARTIIEKLCGSDVWTENSTSPLRRCLVANCLMYATPSTLSCYTQT